MAKKQLPILKKNSQSSQKRKLPIFGEGEPKDTTSSLEESVSVSETTQMDGGSDSATQETKPLESNTEEVLSYLDAQPPVEEAVGDVSSFIFPEDKESFRKESIRRSEEFEEQKREEKKSEAERIIELEDVTEEEINQQIDQVDDNITFLENSTTQFNDRVKAFNEAVESGVEPSEQEVKDIDIESTVLNTAIQAQLNKKEDLVKDRFLKRSTKGSYWGALTREFTEGTGQLIEGTVRIGSYLPLGGGFGPRRIRDIVGEETTDERIGMITPLLEAVVYSNAVAKGDFLGTEAAQTTRENIEKRYEDSDLQAATLSLAKTAPAMLTGTPGLIIQSAEMGYDMIDEAAGDKLTSDQKAAYGATYGVVVGSLERLGLLGTFANKTQVGKFANTVVAKMIKKGEKFSEKGVERVVKELATPLLRGSFSEGGTEALQEIATIGMESAVNVLAEDEIFSEPENTREALGRIWDSFRIGAIAGNVMASLPAIGRAGVASAQEIIRARQASQDFPDVLEYIDLKIKKGEITPEEGETLIAETQNAVDILNEIPTDLTPEQQSEAFTLIAEKKKLEQEIEGKDKALVTGKTERIKAIDEQLTNIATKKQTDENVQERQEQQREVLQPQEQEETTVEAQVDEEVVQQEEVELSNYKEKKRNAVRKNIRLLPDRDFNDKDANEAWQKQQEKRKRLLEDNEYIDSEIEKAESNERASQVVVEAMFQNKELVELNKQQDAKKQQSRSLRKQAVEEEVEGQRDSDMPEVDGAELQDGAQAQEEVTPQEEITKEQRKEAASKRVDEVAEKLKKSLGVDLPKGTKIMGVDQDAIIDVAAQFAKALINTGIEVQEAIRRVTKALSENGEIQESEIPVFNKAILDKVQPEKEVETPKGQKERRGAKSTREFAAEKGVRIDKTADDFYTAQNQADLQSKVSQMTDSQLQELLNDEKSNAGIAAGIELYTRQLERGDDVTTTRTALKKRGTTLGQLVAQFAMMKKATPEALVDMVMSEMEKSGRKLTTKEQAKNAIDKKAKQQKKTKKEVLNDVAKKARKLKFVKAKSDLSKLQSSPLAVVAAAWDGSVEVFAISLEATGNVVEAIDKAVEHLKGTDWYRGITKSSQAVAENRLRSELEGVALGKTETAKELNRARKKLLENKSQIEKLNDLAKELIEAQAQLKDLAEKATAGEDFDIRDAKKVVKRVENAAFAMDKFINAVIPKDWGSILGSSVQGNLLTIKSLIRNPVYNIARELYDIPAKFIAEAFNRARFTGANVVRFIKGDAWQKYDEKPLFSLTAYLYAARYGATKGLSQALKTFATGKKNMDANYEYQMNQSFMPLRAMAYSISDTKFAEAINAGVRAYNSLMDKAGATKAKVKEIPSGVMSVNEKGDVSINDRLKKFYEGTFGIFPELMFRILPLGDTPFFQYAYTKDLVLEGKRRGLKGKDLKKFIMFPDDAAKQSAIEEGRKATFQEESGAAKIATKLQSAIPSEIDNRFGEKIGSIARFLIRTQIPYVKTPVNVINQTADYAIPVMSFAKAMYKLVGPKNKRDIRGASEYIGKAVVGTILIGAIDKLLENDLVVGSLYGTDDPDEKRKRDLAYATQPPNTLNVSGLKRMMQGKSPKWKPGDTAIDYRILGFGGTIMHMKATERDQEILEAEREGRNPKIGRNKEEEQWYSKIAEFSNAPALAKAAIEQTFLAGTNTALQALSGGSEEYDRWATSTMRAASAAVLPNTMNSLARAHYEYLPDTRGDGSLESFTNQILFQTFNADSLPTRVDVFGNKIRNTPDGQNPFFYHLIDPFSTKQNFPDPVVEHVYNVYKETGDVTVVPKFPTRTLRFDGEDYEMNNEEWNEYSAELQKMKSDNMRRLLKDNYHMNSLTPQEQLEELKEEQSYAVQDAFELKERMVNKIKKREAKQK